MLLGYDSCAAVNGAISAIHDGAVLPVHIPSLVEAIGPAVGLAEENLAICWKTQFERTCG